jgi:hypothetical protein
MQHQQQQSQQQPPPSTDESILVNSNKIFDKNVINNESILLNEMAQNSPNHLFNIHKYKLYVEQTEQTLGQIYKQVGKLTELMREYKKLYQSKQKSFTKAVNVSLIKPCRFFLSAQIQFEDLISDPMLNLAKCSYNKELGFVFEKLADLSKISVENSKQFVTLISISLYICITDII